MNRWMVVMQRRKFYIWMVAFCLGLGLMAQPAHAVACLAQKNHPAATSHPGHEVAHHDHDQYHANPPENHDHQCMCLQWCAGLDGSGCTEPVKVIGPAPVQTGIFYNGVALAALPSSQLDPGPAFDRRPFSPDNLILPPQDPLYLQLQSLLC